MHHGALAPLKHLRDQQTIEADGRQQIVGLQFAPDFLGRPFLGESTITAEAATDTDICTFPRNIVDRMVGEVPDMERKLHSQSLKELDEARDWMLTLGRKTAQEKVASFLLDMSRRVSKGDRFDLPMQRTDIADHLGLTIETVSRTLTQFAREGLIKLAAASRSVVLCDKDALRRLNA